MKRRISSLWARSEGVAAIEFAFLFPLILIVFFVSIELVNAFDQKRKVNQLGRTLADLFAQGDLQNPMSLSLAQDIMSAAGPILAPFPSSLATIQASAVGIYQGNSQISGYVCSVYPLGGKRNVGYASDLVVPKNFQRPGARYVMTEISMPYKPTLQLLGSKLVQGFNLNFVFSETVTWPVRSGTSYSGDPEVVLPGGLSCP